MKKTTNPYSDYEIREQIRNFYTDLALKRALPRERIQVLVVDDERQSLHTFQRLLQRDFDIYIANSAREGFAILKNSNIHVIISDQRMPEMTGIDFFKTILPVYKDPIRILLTGYTDLEAAIDSINDGEVYRYISKPFQKPQMQQLIKNAYELYYLRKKTAKLTKDLATTNRQLEFIIREQLLNSEAFA